MKYVKKAQNHISYYLRVAAFYAAVTRQKIFATNKQQGPYAMSIFIDMNEKWNGKSTCG